MLQGRKVGGILVESVVRGGRTEYAVLGIGVNVSLDTQDSQEIAALAISLNEAAGSAVAPEEVLRQVLHDLDSLYLQASHGTGSPLAEWTALLDTLGQRVEARWRDEVYVGLAEDVDPSGNLRLRLDDGNLVTLTAGDVTLHNEGGPAGPGPDAHRSPAPITTSNDV
jgi:BirA family biotin operon repressor/biotin-[acetyl-CoA-carboxylase] ligase